jgi:serine/threonine protein kinase
MLSFEAFDDKKRVTICVDGDLSTKKNFFVDPSWDIIDFVRSAGQRLDVHGLTHCFTFDGRGVSHVDEFNDSDTIVLSANSKWTDAQSLPLARDGDGESSPAAMIDGLPLHVGDYEVGKFLGQGGFGQVRIGTHRSTDEQVALKFAAKKAIRNMNDIMRSNQEFQTLMSLTHSNVIRLMSRVEHAKYVVLAFELMAGGDLHGFLTERGGKGRVVGDVAVTNAEAKLVMRQLLSAVSYAHLNLVVHRDLKLENVFLLRKGSLDKVKIGDFGLCDLFTHQSEKKKFDGWGTMYILPPEVRPGG